MPYSYREVPESEQEVMMYEIDKGDEKGLLVEDLDLSAKTEYEILDEQGDVICSVYNEVDAEALISHLNR